ncbi:MAG: SlyX family protein [Pseudomonadota bacterium]
MSTEHRFIDLETKLAHQEDLVESLNHTVYQQGRRIEQLEAMLNRLADTVRHASESGQGPANDRPPHY